MKKAIYNNWVRFCQVQVKSHVSKQRHSIKQENNSVNDAKFIEIIQSSCKAAV